MVALVLAGAGLVIHGCGSSPGQAPVQRLSIATGGTGGVYYPYGGAIASIISTHLPGVQATAEVTAASVDNLKLIRDRQADIAFSLADTLAEAVKGQGPFAQGGPVQARALAVLYENYTHLVVRGDGPVTRVADLKGRVVSVGAAGSGTELIANRVLAAAGLDPATDIVRQNLGFSQSTDQFRDGKLDAFFISGGVPTAAILDLASSASMPWRLLANDETLPALQRHGAGLYSRIVIPHGVYPGLAADVPVVGVANILVVHAQMSDQLAYDITRLLFERQSQLAVVHPEAAKLSLATAAAAAPTAFHPGAQRYYREKGAWKD